MIRKGSVPKRFEHLFYKLLSKNIPFKISFFIIGIASTIWFLIRVIPKPSRAFYPCMRAAAPFMSSLVIYLLTLSSSSLLLKKARKFLFQKNYVLSIFLVLIAIIAFGISSLVKPLATQAADGTKQEDFIPNFPFGASSAIYPGRVVWAWNPDATDENCTNSYNDAVRGEDGYFLAKNNNQEVINAMFADAILDISGTTSVTLAWDRLFKSFNKKRERGVTGYQDGETIFVKINQGGAGWLTNSSDLSHKTENWALNRYGLAETSPAIVISLLDQLVNQYGIPEENILVGDPIAHIYKHNYDQMVAVFPDVKYIDKSHSDLGRTLISKSTEASIFWSDKGAKMPDAVADTLYTEIENADYLINIAALKAHARAGITLTAKNHFGTHTRDGATHLHPALIAPENDEPINTSYGQYRVLTDIMGHEKMGSNTILFIVDGLWGGTEAVEKPVKWNMSPFNGDWPSSLFISQDQVALESVCFDFLRNEFDDPDGPAKARPLMGAVDDYLHQAADSFFWPEGIVYDPENDGTPIGSLGIHEHWNNKEEKLYSRNLGYDTGIELISTNRSLIKSTAIAKEAESAPVIDAIDEDNCWSDAQWIPIDQTWINWGEEIDSSDFYGRYKVSWSQEQNLLYFFVEITDDVFVDEYAYPDNDYPNFDIVEVFIDEDNSGGLHVFDNNNDWGLNSENAFSYHLAIDAPNNGETNNSFVACDIDGTNWDNMTIEDYADHFPELVIKKTGNKYCYEFSMMVFDDSYDDTSPESSRATLLPGKLMGMSIAYCENDTIGTDRDNFIGSVWVPENANNEHWKNADYFGSVRLVSAETKMNHLVYKIDSIQDIEIGELNERITVYTDINTLFSDPDGDTLTFNLEFDKSFLDVEILHDSITIKVISEFTDNKKVTIKATDGEFEVTEEFEVTFITTNSINNNCYRNRISCYPNPVKNNLTIELEDLSLWSEKINVSIYNLSGKIILSQDLVKYSEIQLDLITIPAGNYLLIVKDIETKRIATRKLNKE